MPLTVPMVASEILMCGLKKVPFAGAAFEVLDSIRIQHELLGQADRVAALEGKLTRFERAQRDLVAREVQTILENLRLPDLGGPALSEEVRNLRQIQDQGWNPSLFEGLLGNSSHLKELKRNPQMYGRILGDHDPVDPERGIHVLLDADKTRILEVSPFAFQQLLAHQARGIPEAKIQVAEGIWAFPSLEAPRRVLPKPLPNEIVNSIGMKLKLVPAGEFEMGSSEAKDEEPRHLVRISQPFYLGVYPVTQREYMQVMRKNPSHFSGGDRLPVENVSWFSAVGFCNALSQKEKLPPFYAINGQAVNVLDWNAPGYRLPTEAEWEYACRAGTTTRYSFGDQETGLDHNAWYWGNSSGQTHPVGEKKPNAFGLHDMHGNVWEWCWDGYSAEYYQQSPADDPRGPEHGSSRVIRGGSWSYAAGYCRAAFRSRITPTNARIILGLRLARVQSVR
jgi:formylglycine-generating enzyme required for sulfatase activity